MIDNPEPNQVMQEKQRDFEDQLFKEYSDKEAEELCQEHSVVPEYISSFQEWYHDYLSDPKNQDPNDMIDKRHLIDDWWDEQGKYIINDKCGGWAYNPTPYQIDPVSEDD
jgi:hypothetical protein